jgi:3-deoxy-7-phosphoheptulonate synthase
MEVPAASEFLDPATAHYYSDLISWGCIGARTSSSQTHRQMASALPMPIAMKNNTDGNVNVAVQGVKSASSRHTYVGPDLQGKLSIIRTKGNVDAHVVLRGGEGQPNYDPQSIAGALNKLEKADLPLRLIVDCSHDNSFKKHEQQCHVFQSIIHQVIEGNRYIRGAILESNLFAGSQHLTADSSRLQYAVSVTDPCLDWATTEKLITWCASKLKQETAVFT